MPSAAWIVSDNSVVDRLAQDSGVLEAALETWIHERPELVANGVTWVAQQLVLPDRSRLDLLGLTPDDEWVVTELKRGAVTRATLAQVLHYAVYVGSMVPAQFREVLNGNVRFRGLSAERQAEIGALLDEEEEDSRRVSLTLVGTSQMSTVQLATHFLARSGFTIAVRVVTFDLFRSPSGQTILVREVEEPGETAASPDTGGPAESVRAKARSRGVAEPLEEFLGIAGALRLATKARPPALTKTPWRRGNPTLLYLRPEEGRLHVWVSSDNLVRHLGFNDDDLRELGPGGNLTPADASAFAHRFETLVGRVRERLALQAQADAPLPPEPHATTNESTGDV
jgi:hypothetical protein